MILSTYGHFSFRKHLLFRNDCPQSSGVASRITHGLSVSASSWQVIADRSAAADVINAATAKMLVINKERGEARCTSAPLRGLCTHALAVGVPARAACLRIAAMLLTRRGGGVWVRREINLYLFYFHLSLSVLTDVPLECGASQRCCFLSMLGCTGTWNPTTAGVVAINLAWNERDGRTVFDAQISIT